ncbi:MAG: sulfur carrier protein ThiS [Gammaproteobacteria bacterium]
MNIYINGKAQDLIANLSIQELVNQLDLGNKRYALELNQAILPRSQYAATLLSDGDRIEIIHAVGGG